MKICTNTKFPLWLLVAGAFTFGCQSSQENESAMAEEASALYPVPVVLDTDTNNELDDQHALAYLLFNSDVFDIRGITVNATSSGGDINDQYAEAVRVMQLCQAFQRIPLYKGANSDFEAIKGNLRQPQYDGRDAVEFIIREARRDHNQKLVLLPVGKLTNIALAIAKAPDIRDRVRIVWLGSNYPEPGEHNQVNDTAALNYLLDLDVPFEMVTVRYGQPSGTDAVRVTPAEIEEKLAGAGPESDPIEGRHGGTFSRFGDYSVDLFRNAELHGDPPSRALFDVVAVAIVKNPDWGQSATIPAPILDGENWRNRPGNYRKIRIWENFDREAILEDFFATMDDPDLQQLQ